MLVQAQVVPWWGTGRPAEFSPSGTNPSRASPIGRRIGGYDLQTESFQRPRAEQHTHFREIRNSNFFGALPWGSECSGNYQPRGNGKTARGIGSADPRRLPPAPGTESPLEIWLGRWNRPRADLAGTWTTRVQARRVPADPTADRKPKACWRCGSADRTAPKQISQAPGLREFQARRVPADPTADR